MGAVGMATSRGRMRIRIRIAGVNSGCPKGRIIRICCSTPSKVVRGPARRLTKFTGAGLLTPKRGSIIAVAFTAASVTSFSTCSTT